MEGLKFLNFLHVFQVSVTQKLKKFNKCLRQYLGLLLHVKLSL
jgi:hypothetical protein